MVMSYQLKKFLIVSGLIISPCLLQLDGLFESLFTSLLPYEIKKEMIENSRFSQEKFIKDLADKRHKFMTEWEIGKKIILNEKDKAVRKLMQDRKEILENDDENDHWFENLKAKMDAIGNEMKERHHKSFKEFFDNFGKRNKTGKTQNIPKTKADIYFEKEWELAMKSMQKSINRFHETDEKFEKFKKEFRDTIQEKRQSNIEKRLDGCIQESNDYFQFNNTTRKAINISN